LAPFLDKFAYRNPKSVQHVVGKYKRGQSIAERRSATGSVLESQLSLPVNDPSFLEKEGIGEQDEFFHTFFVERADVTNSRIIRNTGKDTAGDDRTKKAKERPNQAKQRTPIRILWSLITTGILILRKKLSLIHSRVHGRRLRAR
jgi:hypothetical protein